MKNLRGLYFARPSGTYTKSSGIGVAAAKKAAPAPYFFTNYPDKSDVWADF